MSLRARIERWLSPGLSTCGRCKRPWRTPAKKYLGRRDGVHHYRQLTRPRWWGYVGVKPHTTYYGGGAGCFALCQDCWAALTPSERVPYYESVITLWWRLAVAEWDTKWMADLEGDGPALIAAVKAGR